MPATATQPRRATRTATAADRQAQLAQIHIARKELAMTEDEYRDLISAKWPGQRSAAGLDHQQRAELLHHFQRLGWKGRVGGSRANPATGTKASTATKPWGPELRKLWSLWMQLADAGLVEHRTAAALSAWCERQTAGADGRGGVNRIEWLKPAQRKACIEAAKRWLDRGEQP